MARPTAGDLGWVGLAGYVIAFDIWAARSEGRDTLSQSYWRAVCHPVRRWPTLALSGYLAAHLLHAIPDRYDPLRRLGGLIDASDSAGGCPQRS